MIAEPYSGLREETLGQRWLFDTGQLSSRTIQDLWSPVQLELPLKREAAQPARHSWRLDESERKVLQILLLLIATPYLGLLMVTAGPPTMGLLISLIYFYIE